MADELTKRQISDALFTDTGETGRARCNLCSNVYSVGSGLTNKLNHLKVHPGHVGYAMRILSSSDRVSELKRITAELEANPPVVRRRGRPPKVPVGAASAPVIAKAVASPSSKKQKTMSPSDVFSKSQMMQFHLKLQSFQDTILSTVQTLHGEVQALRTSVTDLQNRDRLRNNRELAIRAKTEPAARHAPLHPLLRTNKSFGGGITGGQLYQPPPVLIGTAFPSPPFPKTLAALAMMDRQQIHELAVIMDNDFGIVSGDSVEACREKLQRAITDTTS